MKITFPARGALTLWAFLLPVLLATPIFAQNVPGPVPDLAPSDANTAGPQNSAAPSNEAPRPYEGLQAVSESIIQPHEDKRAYGVLPNYRTAEADVPFAPITNHRKLMIGVKDSFDGVAYPLAAFFAGIAQLSDSNPSFGQGAKGFAKRYGSAFADQVIGNMLTESFLPIALHEDPRFFRKGTGKFWNRVAYAATRVVICKTDSGRAAFNAPEILGNGISASIGNFYYPDSRGLSPTFSRMATQIGTDSFSNVLKEFWPDVKHYYSRKHRERLQRQQQPPPIATE